MEIIGLLIMIVGGIIMFGGGIWFIVETFRSGILWGLACLFIPFVGLIWLITHWENGKAPFGTYLLGFLLMLGGMVLGGHV